MKFLVLSLVSALSQGAPTRFLTQTGEAEVKPHSSFVQSEHDLLAHRTEESKKTFLEAMNKLEVDAELFKQEEEESRVKARHLKGNIISTIV